MPFIPHTEEDVGEMLAALGVRDIEALFDEIPDALKAGALDKVPAGLTEMQVSRLLSQRARIDGEYLGFIGAGAYEHHIPAAVWQVATRGEFYSAYTPYQAEASQGTLQLIYEYQSMMASLLALDVSNASMYDGASALAEAVLMAVRSHKSSRRVLLPRNLNPRYRRVVVRGGRGSTIISISSRQVCGLKTLVLVCHSPGWSRIPVNSSISRQRHSPPSGRPLRLPPANWNTSTWRLPCLVPSACGLKWRSSPS